MTNSSPTGMDTRDVPAAYYELSWAILSTIGLSNMLVGGMVAGIVGYSPILLVPIITSAAGAIANGLCYYAFYADYPEVNTAVASAFGDLGWLIQEAGLSFYSYVILTRVLRNRARFWFKTLFWSLIAIISALRIVILASRVRFILGHSAQKDLQLFIDHMHIGYFVSIALVEIVSSFFLLRKFNSALKISVKAALKGGLFNYLMRSTEIRLASLAILGVMRAVTYSFQDTAQSATGIASQLDRFAYTLECMFPVVMFMDILASRIVFANDTVSSNAQQSSNQHQRNRRGHFTQTGTVNGDVAMYPMGPSGVERQIEVKAGNSTTHTSRSDTRQRTASQEYIIEHDPTRTVSADEESSIEGYGPKLGGISKTVEFKVSEARLK